jgi:hypothetical protein
MKCENKSELGETVVFLTNTGTQGHFIQNPAEAIFCVAFLQANTNLVAC